MRNWIYRGIFVALGFFLPLGGYAIGVRNAPSPDLEVACMVKESLAVRGCELAATQMMHDSDAWRRRAENCQYHLQELMRVP